MCYVFLQAETFALRGGPGSGGNPPLQGAYSAILIQTSPTFDIQGNQTSAAPGAGLGLLALTVPAGGPAVGNMLIFDSQTQNTFVGKANGLSNRVTGELICLVSGTEFKITTTTAGTGTANAVTSTETISGRLSASRDKGKKNISAITGEANLAVAGIPFVTVQNGVLVNFVRNGVPTAYAVVGYLSGSGDAAPGAFDLTVSN